jgi:hypothetical protein
MLIERHYAEIGDLVDLTREHMAFERAVLDNVIEARERAIDAQSPRTAALADLRVREAVTDLIASPRSTPGSEPTRSSRTAGRPSRSSNNGSRTGRRRYMNRTPHPTRSMPQRPDSLRRRRPVPD